MKKEELIHQLQVFIVLLENRKEDPVFVECVKKTLEILYTEFSGEEPMEIIKLIMEKEGIKQHNLADKMGTSRQNVSQMLNRGIGMYFSSFHTLINALGYEIICRKKEN